jgi:hypothetical protein
VEIIKGNQWAKDGDVIISLGVPFGNRIDERAFWEGKYKRMKQKLSTWRSLRCRTQKGRVLLSKLFVWSRFRYWAQSMLMPDAVSNNIDSDVRAMVWAKDPDFAAAEAGTQAQYKRWMIGAAEALPWGTGGLGMLQWKLHLKSLLQRWVTRYLDASKSQYKHLLDMYVRDRHPEGRGVVLTTTPTRQITQYLPKRGAFEYWAKAIEAFRDLQLHPMSLDEDENMNGPRLGAEPTFTNLRGEILAIRRSFQPQLWTGGTVPYRIRRLIRKGLAAQTIDQCYCNARKKWWNHNQMSIFIDRAGCVDPGLKGDLLLDWDAIAAELPRSWQRMMREEPPTARRGEVVHSNGKYYMKGRGGRLSRVELDVKGTPYLTGEEKTAREVGPTDRTVLWNGHVMGPERDVFPNPAGWVYRGFGIAATLDEITVQDGYLIYLRQHTSRPSCETNWRRYVHEELPWEDIWASFLRPGIYAPHHYMTFFKVLHRALPTATRTRGSQRCRLGCRCDEHFLHFLHCRALRRFWGTVTDHMSALGRTKLRPTKLLIYFTLKRQQGELKVVNRHMRGLIWLAWKALWQQLANIHAHGGQFDQQGALTQMYRIHHTLVLAALRDYKIVQMLKASGGRKRQSEEQETNETFRVWPYVSITEGSGEMRYTEPYYSLLQRYSITPSPEILTPNES